MMLDRAALMETDGFATGEFLWQWSDSHTVCQLSDGMAISSPGPMVSVLVLLHIFQLYPVSVKKV